MSKYKNIEVAPDDNIDKYYAFAESFLKEIFGLEPPFLLTDESSLRDFDLEIDFEGDYVIHRTDEYLKKIRYLYDVDVSDVEGLILYKVLEKIVNDKGGNSDN